MNFHFHLSLALFLRIIFFLFLNVLIFSDKHEVFFSLFRHHSCVAKRVRVIYIEIRFQREDDDDDIEEFFLFYLDFFNLHTKMNGKSALLRIILKTRFQINFNFDWLCIESFVVVVKNANSIKYNLSMINKLCEIKVCNTNLFSAQKCKK